ncbi:uncharacterized protein N7500_004347 [Penicillium coprophilum]|uniref:uncharacterized protein n=1 Tax=Penicillium coprophilum TaxID=36646 RepID=UPI002383D09B|nr:uncharacterized protein N7500_010977 [Penicillium coprophilum]XP_056536018.1 uncharacterized protein N7500_004347 [Penicillium coprophilum]KAJ5150788.1 hypothetical protein N7500_010977 [Penicillium coprophilum]KAJ5171564.1 hypothetical protein N7500_004347 [Penicillium coprophilum]
MLKDCVVATKTYNSEDSLVVTHPTTNSPACGLSTAERTGSPVFHTLWSYVLDYMRENIMSTMRIVV